MNLKSAKTATTWRAKQEALADAMKGKREADFRYAEEEALLVDGAITQITPQAMERRVKPTSNTLQQKAPSCPMSEPLGYG